MHNKLKWRAYVSADELDLHSLRKSDCEGWWTVVRRSNRRRYYVRLSEAYDLAMYRCTLEAGGVCSVPPTANLYSPAREVGDV